ncbi:hypothetical protein HNQ55_001646 [Thalassotalea piscium]|uniref:DUF4314 domain-containing protein n=2 Tax=Thalassotalea piscium TaxID=1230533 RepID=A0A7X0NGT4_9GAMM|nr:hypothetical protein [Thalassotalea piscium]
MDDDPNPIAVGDLGYVTNVNGIGKPWCQVTVNWDSGRTLRLLYPQDNFVIVE